MATLVQFLAAGVKGAESGTATFVLRGSASSAASFLYNDFERTAQPGTNIITLDANGAAEVYCSVYVDVTLKNSAGATLRTVTVGNGSSNVEVRSTSFKGDDYDGNPSNTAGQPITLTSVLNLWATSAGTTDFKVLVGGVATNLQTAFASFAGMFINVKDPAYGAVGDGVTSDTTAVSNAIAAAAASGGVVVFPPGTYLCAQMAITAPNFACLGFGQATIKGSSGSTFVIQDNTPGAVKVFSGLKFTSNGSANGAFDIEGDNTVYIDQCAFDQAGYTTDLIGFRDDNGKYFISRCRFVLDASASNNPIRHKSGVGKQVFISDCHFTIPASYTKTVIFGSCFSIDNCYFDGSLVTSGTYVHIDALDPIIPNFAAGNVVNCTFIDGGSSGYAFSLLELGANCDFSEANNSFFGFTAPTVATDAGHIYLYSNDAAFNETSRVNLGSRLGKQLLLAVGATSNLSGIKAFLVADTLVLTHTNASGLQVSNSPANMPPGLRWAVAVLNSSGGTRTFSFTGTGQAAADIQVTGVVTSGWAFANFISYLRGTDTVATACIGVSSASI